MLLLRQRLLLLLTLGSVAFSGSPTHTLHCFYTSVWEPGEQSYSFFAVGQVDGIIAGQYDSQARQAKPRADWIKRIEKDDPDFLAWNTQIGQNAERRLGLDLANLTKQHKQSGGVHTWQEMYGCELSEGDDRIRVFNQYSYNGNDFLSFDMETLTWTATNPRAQITKRKWDTDLARSRWLKAYLEDECVAWLRKFLKYGEDVLLRKEIPAVKVTRVKSYNGLETLICRVYGFYPKEIDATWMKDGDVWEQETFRGGVVPNLDGTFHTLLRIEIDPKDRDLYRCHVDHAALERPVDVAWEEPASRHVGLIVGVAVVVGVVFFLAMTVLWIGKQRHGANNAEGAPE